MEAEGVKEKEVKQAHVFISGSVHGVGFRQFIKWKARKLGLTGWVGNLPAGKAGTSDGRVEAVIQGEKKNIEIVLAICRKGPMLAQVKNVEVTWEEVKEQFPDFTIRHL